MSWLVKLANRDTDFLNIDFAESRKINSFGLPHIFLDTWIQKLANQKLLILSRGPSGSGKSRMSRELGQQYGAPVFSSDDYFMENGEYVFDPNRLGENHERNYQRTEEALKNEQPIVIVDNTNTEFWEMKPYVELARQYGYAVDFKEPDWNPELRNSEGGWNVDFLDSMQNQPDRDKIVPREILEDSVQKYQYDPSVEAVLNSERPRDA